MISHRRTLGVLLALAALTQAVAVSSAETGGHFTSESGGATIITGIETPSHSTELTVPGLTGIVCGEARYEARFAFSTSTEASVTPTYGNCKTTGGAAKEVTVDVNGCTYRLTIGKKSTADNTADLVCGGATNFIAITHPSCEMRIPAQNNIVGVAYNTTIEEGKHAITLSATAKGFTTNFESGLCVLLGTKHTSELTGSVVAVAFEESSGPLLEGKSVGITATGSEG